MALRSTAVTDAAPEVDALDGFVLPRQRGDLVDQGAAERTLLDAYRSGRIHHGWILGGPKGIGKSTLAFRFARFVLTHPDPRAPEVQAARDLSVDMGGAVARRIAGGAHTDLLHLRRPWDEKNKRFKTDLPIDEIRRTVSFFGSTAGEGGWRIAIVDAADDLNANAANALLKVLEEPPPRSLFLVVAHAPGRLLPTIRSRCRRLDLERLPPHRIAEALGDFGVEGEPATLAAAADLADGSLRRAILLVQNDGVRLWRSLEKIVAGLPDLDVRAAEARGGQASQTLVDGIVRAPFDGVVVERLIEPGEYVRADSPIVRVATVDRLRLNIQVPEAHVASARVGAAVSFSVSAYPERTWTAAIDRRGVAVGAQSRDVLAEASLANPDGALLPGMFATVELTVGEDQLPVIPASAIVTRDGRSHAFVEVDGRAIERVLSLGPKLAGERVSVRRGLKAGESVIVAPPADLKNGSAVN